MTEAIDAPRPTGAPSDHGTQSFPRIAARTMNFQLGVPRGFVVSPDGERVVFLRAGDAVSRDHALWVHDVQEQRERLVADARSLLGDDGEELTEEEKAHRQRHRITTAGVVGFATDADVTLASFALSSRLFVVDLVGDQPAREYPTAAPVVDPRLDPTGRRVAYVGHGALRVVELDTGAERVVAGPTPQDPAEVSFGLAEFVAGEELGRSRGYWWAPDGEALLVQRTDESGVGVWHIADPAHPEREPVRVRYPQAGTDNAVVSLAVVPLAGPAVEVDWRSDDDAGLEYLVDISWESGQPLLTLLSRDQRRAELRDLDPASGHTRTVRVETDDAWVSQLRGTPRRLPDGRLLHGLDEGDVCRVAIDGVAVSPHPTCSSGLSSRSRMTASWPS